MYGYKSYIAEDEGKELNKGSFIEPKDYGRIFISGNLCRRI